MAKRSGGLHILYVTAARHSPTSSQRTIAVCDLGTFTGLLLIARSAGGRLTPLAEERHTVDLLSGKGRNGRLNPAALARASKVVTRFARLAGEHGADTSAIVCTAAIRDAPNSEQFARSLQRVAGCPVRVLSAKREAELSALGATSGIRVSHRPTIVVDIGGGSTEVVFKEEGRTRFRLVPCGAARATADWNKPFRQPALELAEYYKRSSDAIFSDLPVMRMPSPRVIGVGGTLVTLAAIFHGLRAFDAKRLHGTVLTRPWIAAMADRLVGMDQPSIRRLIPFDPRRARILTAGTFLWAGVLNRLHASRVIVSVRGLRWGVAVRLSEQGRL